VTPRIIFSPISKGNGLAARALDKRHQRIVICRPSMENAPTGDPEAL
jgi:hypothetical protein